MQLFKIKENSRILALPYLTLSDPTTSSTWERVVPQVTTIDWYFTIHHVEWEWRFRVTPELYSAIVEWHKLSGMAKEYFFIDWLFNEQLTIKMDTKYTGIWLPAVRRWIEVPKNNISVV